MKRAPWCSVLIAGMLAGCASNPDQSVFIMPAPVSVNTGMPAAPGPMAVRLQPVILPDYLDTTDLVTRTGQYEIQASRTGRWGERLSKGVTRALAADLAHRLRANVAADEPAETPSPQLEVSISAFDVTPGSSVLAASWKVVWKGDVHPPGIQHGIFSTSIAQPGGDAAVVAAMTQTVAELSDGIAATMRADDRRFALPK